MPTWGGLLIGIWATLIILALLSFAWAIFRHYMRSPIPSTSTTPTTFTSQNNHSIIDTTFLYHSPQPSNNNIGPGLSPNQVAVAAPLCDPRKSTEPICSICLDEFNYEQKTERTRIVKNCEHVFHSVCIRAWLSRINTCPYCQTIALDIEAESEISDTEYSCDGPSGVLHVTIKKKNTKKYTFERKSSTGTSSTSTSSRSFRDEHHSNDMRRSIVL